jgi:hypothetical protein
MNMSVSPIRPQQGIQASPTDFSSLSGKGGQQNGLAGGGNSIDPSSLLFANQSQSQVNFAPPNSTENQTSGATGAQGNDPSSMIQQIMSLLQQLMQMLTQSNGDPASNKATNLAAQGSGSGGGGGVQGSGGGGGEAASGATGGEGVGNGAGAGAGAAEGASQGVNDVGSDTSLTGSGDLHLPQQLEQYRGDIMDAAKATGMPPSVIAGQIWAESRGKLDAASTNVNGKADAGLMQVNADTFKSLQQQNPGLLSGDVNDSHTNIMAGALYLRDQNKQFGDMGAALRAYNSGPDKVNQADLSDTGGIGGASYPSDVLNFAKIIESGQGNLPA